MATTTVPETFKAMCSPQPSAQPKTAAPVLTPAAISKVKEIMASQSPVPSGLRLSVVGGGCSGFQYSMAFENGAGMMDKVFDFDGLKVYVDATSLDVSWRSACRLRRNPGRRGLQVRKPEREEHLRLRFLVQRLSHSV
jgi:iron-sulfur cluster assembly accessory protein